MKRNERHMDDKFLPQFRDMYFAMEHIQRVMPDKYPHALKVMGDLLRKDLLRMGMPISPKEAEGMAGWIMEKLKKKYGHEAPAVKQVLNVDALLS